MFIRLTVESFSERIQRCEIEDDIDIELKRAKAAADMSTQYAYYSKSEVKRAAECVKQLTQFKNRFRLGTK